LYGATRSRFFLQPQDGYAKPDDPGARERGAWNVYIETDNIDLLFDEISRQSNVRVTRAPDAQPYGQIEFDVVDPNGYVLVFAQPTQRERLMVPAAEQNLP
jgi:uncharacterized glyoxalase superfamily protein PhnB